MNHTEFPHPPLSSWELHVYLKEGQGIPGVPAASWQGFLLSGG